MSSVSKKLISCDYNSSDHLYGYQGGDLISEGIDGWMEFSYTVLCIMFHKLYQ